MKKSRREIRQISKRLFDLSPQKFAELTSFVEATRGSNVGGALAQEALDVMRRRLVRDRPRRHLTLQRVFCEPFADLLDSDVPAGVKRFGRIARAAIAPCWQLAQDLADPRLMTAARASLPGPNETPASIADEEARLLGAGKLIWAHWALVIRHVVDNAERDQTARDRLVAELGGENMLAELQDIGEILTLAPEATRLQSALAPRPVGELVDADVLAIRRIVAAAVARRECKPGYLVFITLARLGDPNLGLAVFQDLAEYPSRLDGATLAAVAQRCMVSGATSYFERIAGPAPAKLDDLELSELALDYLTRVQQFDQADTEVKQAVATSRPAAEVRLKALLLENVVTGAAESILPALGAGDDSEDALESQMMAENRARALSRSSRMAATLGIQAEVDAGIATVMADLERKVQNLLDGPESPHLERDLFAAIRLTELLAGSQRADELRRSAMARFAPPPSADSGLSEAALTQPPSED